MPKFVTIGYGDRAGYEQTDPSVRDAAHEQDDRLQAAGALLGIAGDPVQVRNHDGAGVRGDLAKARDRHAGWRQA